jgi:hypothetical protein
MRHSLFSDLARTSPNEARDLLLKVALANGYHTDFTASALGMTPKELRRQVQVLDQNWSKLRKSFRTRFSRPSADSSEPTPREHFRY